MKVESVSELVEETNEVRIPHGEIKLTKLEAIADPELWDVAKYPNRRIATPSQQSACSNPGN